MGKEWTVAIEEKVTSNVEAAAPYLAELTILLKEYVYMLKSDSLFKIKVGKTTISEFTLKQMPGCCGIAVSTGASVHKKYQGRGVGTILNRMRFALAKYQTYSAIICTDVMTNEPQRKILAKNGWKDAFVFKNKKTKNDVALSYYLLDQVEEKPKLTQAEAKRILEEVEKPKPKRSLVESRIRESLIVPPISFPKGSGIHISNGGCI